MRKVVQCLDYPDGAVYAGAVCELPITAEELSVRVRPLHLCAVLPMGGEWRVLGSTATESSEMGRAFFERALQHVDQSDALQVVRLVVTEVGTNDVGEWAAGVVLDVYPEVLIEGQPPLPAQFGQSLFHLFGQVQEHIEAESKVASVAE